MNRFDKRENVCAQILSRNWRHARSINTLGYTPHFEITLYLEIVSKEHESFPSRTRSLYTLIWTRDRMILSGNLCTWSSVGTWLIKATLTRNLSERVYSGVYVRDSVHVDSFFLSFSLISSRTISHISVTCTFKYILNHNIVCINKSINLKYLWTYSDRRIDIKVSISNNM